jgi:sugar phosphate permease
MVKNSANLSHQKATPKKNRLLAWMVWGLAAAYFFSDYFARVSPGVMADYLQRDFSVTAAGLGILSSFFYYPYIAMQIPVGLMVDRYSVKWLLTIMATLTAIGCGIFGMADTIMMAAIGRILIGFSAAFAFVSALRLAAVWFPPEELGLLAGMTQALGMLGASVGEAPVSILVSWVGWRHTMLIMSFIFIVLAALIYRFVQDRPKNKKIFIKHVEHMPIRQSLKIVLSNSQTWINAVFAGLVFAPTAVLGELWGPTYLQYGRGLGMHSAAFATGLIFIGWGIGGPITGWISDRICRRKPLMLISALSGLAIMSMIIYLPNLSKLQIYGLFLLFGMTNTGVAIAYAVSTEIHKKEVVGTSIAFTNMSSIFIGAMLQPIVGKLIDWKAGELSNDITMLGFSDFKAVLWILPVCSAAAFLLALLIKETHCTSVDMQ